MYVLIIVLSLLLFIMLILISVYYYKKDSESGNTRGEKDIFHCSIEALANRIAKEEVSKESLKKLIDHVASKHPFPVSSDRRVTQHHLKFVHEFCLNKNADGALIVMLGNTLKRVNSEYALDIDTNISAAVDLRDSSNYPK